jgi:hypothetical protein
MASKVPAAYQATKDSALNIDKTFYDRLTKAYAPRRSRMERASRACVSNQDH